MQVKAEALAAARELCTRITEPVATPGDLPLAIEQVDPIVES